MSFESVVSLGSQSNIMSLLSTVRNPRGRIDATCAAEPESKSFDRLLSTKCVEGVEEMKTRLFHRAGSWSGICQGAPPASPPPGSVVDGSAAETCLAPVMAVRGPHLTFPWVARW
jgi:hypothetical protein